MSSRISVDGWAMEVAHVTSKRSTCLRRHVGCVLLNGRGHLLATGHNGVASGQPHCNELVTGAFPHACPGAEAPPGATGTKDECQAIHAEQNALLQCRDVWEIHTCYTTASPCFACVKLLLNTGCTRIVFAEEYPDPRAQDLWLRVKASGGRERTWRRL